MCFPFMTQISFTEKCNGRKRKIERKEAKKILNKTTEASTTAKGTKRIRVHTSIHRLFLFFLRHRLTTTPPKPTKASAAPAPFACMSVAPSPTITTDWYLSCIIHTYIHVHSTPPTEQCHNHERDNKDATAL